MYEKYTNVSPFSSSTAFSSGMNIFPSPCCEKSIKFKILFSIVQSRKVIETYRFKFHEDSFHYRYHHRRSGGVGYPHRDEHCYKK